VDHSPAVQCTSGNVAAVGRSPLEVVAQDEMIAKGKTVASTQVQMVPRWLWRGEKCFATRNPDRRDAEIPMSGGARLQAGLLQRLEESRSYR
jgi:hypothetical protein